MNQILLRAEGVSKRFGGVQALQNVSLDVHEGEAVGIIGPNGAGKTTLFHVLSGFVRPDSGRVAFRGEDVLRLPPYEINRLGLSRTFQIVRPFPGLTVLENLMVGAFSNRVWDPGAEMTAARDRALYVAEQVGLSPWLHREAVTLPHGALKMLEVGRAIMREPSLLLLDEPFGGLGSREIDQVAGLVERLKGSGMTVVIIEHRLRALMQLVRRVVVLNFGQKIADGTPEEVSDDPVVQEAYLGRKGMAS